MRKDSSRTVADTLVNDLDEFVVTGTRVSKRIIDIPYSVARLNYVDYRYDKKIGSADVLSPIPGLFLQSRYGNHDVRFSIRGFGSRSNSGIRGIRILLDDIPESEPDGQTRIEAIDFNSIGRIEIAKGSASSLYTNAPGGVVNFINDIGFHRSSIMQFNQLGSFGLQRNGIKAAVRTKQYGLLTTYSRQHYEGYRAHNQEDWHILNMVMESTPMDNSNLKILGYFVDGQIKLPGSLTKEEFDQDPYQAAQRSIDRDEKRISTKGRLGIRFNSKFGESLNHKIEITAFGTIKYFERTSREYRIINRYGLGLRTSYTNTSKIGQHTNEFSVGGDLLLQPARTENYNNISGKKGDQLNQLVDEKISNSGFYLSENFEVLDRKLYVLLTGRYDHVAYDLAEETLPSRQDERIFNAFTPKIALNYKLTTWMSAYTSFGLGFDSPAKNELESLMPSDLYNHELEAQESKNFEVGLKGNLLNFERDYFRKILIEATLFNIQINNEIVPFEVLGDVFFRNAAKTNRTGLELGSRLEIVKDLNLIFAYTYSDFKYDSYLAKTIYIDSTAAIREKEEDYSDNIVPSVPKNNLYLAVSYNHDLIKHVKGFAKISYTGISGLWVDDANSDKTEGYKLLNTILGVDMALGNFNILISGGVNNLFDETYVGFTNTNSADFRFYEAGAPRNYYLSINLGYTF
ncbi:MAG: TonB-dependent receptor [Bacteroidales bacterium]|nr:TonB-dependent receptor [Bacteroidales bacterium]MCF8402720.1 TonB-dependent receptor [Bacteroidales bacterium]